MKEPLCFEGNGIYLCLDDDKKWVLQHNEKNYTLNNDDTMLPLLPVLEIDYEIFVQKSQELNILEDFNKTFPIIPLLKYPFDNKRIFWAELAMNWIEKDNRKNDLNDWAKTIQLDWMPQKLKHRYFRQFHKTGKKHYSTEIDKKTESEN
jgi:hypothetical protein